MIMVVAAGDAHAQSPGSSTEPRPPIDQLTLTDDMVAAVGIRRVEARRVEALVSTGSDATHHAAVRATDKLGTVSFELTGNVLASDVLDERNDAAARIEHATDHDRVRTYGSYGTEHVSTTRQSFDTDLRDATYGAGWTGWRSAGRFEVQALGEQLDLRDERATSTLDLAATAQSARAGFTSRRLQAFGLDHELGAGVSVTRASSRGTEGDVSLDVPHMSVLARSRRGNSRFLRAYINDTIRVIESLDISGGFVFEHWRWLASMPPLPQSPEEQMDTEAREMIGFLVGPRLGAFYRVTPELALTATASRSLRVPTWQQLMRPVQNDSMMTRPGAELRAQTVTGGEVGPALVTGSLEARAVAYVNRIDAPLTAVTIDDTLRETTNLGRAREAGVDAAATWRLAKPWLAGVGYTFTATRVTDGGAHGELAGQQLAHTPRHRATAMLAFDEPRIATVTGTLRYTGSRFDDDRNTIVLQPVAVVDAMATRKLTHGLAGFVAVENVMNRRYVTNVAAIDTIGAPRMVHVGVRLDSARW